LTIASVGAWGLVIESSAEEDSKPVKSSDADGSQIRSGLSRILFFDSPRRWAFVLFAVSVMVRLPFMAQTTDDAFITYRYAENIAGGLGFVYNLGERVLGVTTPLYTLILALASLIGIKPVLVGPWLNVMADSLVAPVLAHRDPTDRLKLASILYALSPFNAYWSASGMETGMVCLALATALVAYERERHYSCAVALSTALLLRIDTVALVAALAVHRVLRRRPVPLKPMLLFVALLIPWVVFAWAYFGNPVPQSVWAKSALPKADVASALVSILVKGFLHPGTPFGALLIVGAACTLMWARREMLTAGAIFAFCYMAAYTLTRSQLHPWYYPPATIGYIPLAAAGLSALVMRFKPRLAGPFVTAVAIGASLFGVFRLHRGEIPNQIALDAFLRTTGMALRRVAPPESTVFLKDIGYLGYYSGLRVHDFAGLVTPVLVPYRSRLDFTGAVKQVQSDFVLVASDVAQGMDANPWFHSNYEVSQIFRAGSHRMVLLEKKPSPR